MPDSHDSRSDHERQLDVIVHKYYEAVEQGDPPHQDHFIAEHPEFAAELREFFSDQRLLEGVALDEATNSATYIGSSAIGVEYKGRYRLDRILGEGAFGRVYLGYDELINRQVAIKVPNRARFQKPEDAEAYLTEARTVASLDHSHIVPVFDVGRTEDGSIYVVSQFIEGITLADRIKAGSLPERDAAQLLANVARALQHAHDRRLIHRDVKPANILLQSKTDKVYVTDFGLAIREQDYLQKNIIAGTASYMSPEQARGEGHRLDGRSDIFSMGIILYEILTGKKPFRGSSPLETLHEVISKELKRPRDIRESIPLELERICLKALSKLTSDRYATAAELADDLEHWLKPTAAGNQKQVVAEVVPKGLRSFDAGDADFFLDLLPGPRNRAGLPESIAFWKQRIEQTDPEQTFNVGLIYGPSGCGKSSLVKAGLLPHLSQDVVAIYVEATADDTEARIVRELDKQFFATREGEAPAGPKHMGTVPQDSSAGASPSHSPATSVLRETLSTLRRGEGRKVVIIIDQFEQWLHAHRADADAELVRALRQCDGGRVQAIVMVRDDFSVAASRFMRALDTRIVEAQNYALIDLFDIDHAANVLTKFGQAFGKLPANAVDLSNDQRTFVNDVATGLAQDSKVIPVRLSLFAEMVKAKPWTRDTLQQVGGTAGVGVNFLEETFSSPQGNPNHRLHAVAARSVLRALLPELGTDIRGHIRSQADLLEASGYQDRPSEFADLLRTLDSELRLITPTDAEGETTSDRQGVSPPSDSSEQSENFPRSAPLATRFFQLTHDYLVPSLREWLTRKRKETRRGRAELKLDERAALWNAKPENRHMPSLTEWLSICTLTDSRHWTAPQRAMMRKAGRLYLAKWGSRILFLLVAGIAMHLWLSSILIAGLRDQVITAVDAAQNNRGTAVPFAIRDLQQFPKELVLSELTSRFQRATGDQKLGLAFALADNGIVDADFLVSQVDRVTLSDTTNLYNALAIDRQEAVRALQSSAAIRFVPPAWHVTYFRWDKTSGQNRPVDWDKLLTSKPLKEVVISELSIATGKGKAPVDHSADSFAVQATADVELAQGSYVMQLTADGKIRVYLDEQLVYDQFSYYHRKDALEFKVTDGRHQIRVDYFHIDRGYTLSVELRSTDHVRRKAKLATLALYLGETEIAEDMCQIANRPDPAQRTYFVDEFQNWDVDTAALLGDLRSIDNPSLRSAICLAVARIPVNRISLQERQAWQQLAEEWYVTSPDRSIHSAAGCLLRKLQVALPDVVSGDGLTTEMDWYKNLEGQTFLRITSGSFHVQEEDNYHRKEREVLISESFWISDCEVSVGQFERFLHDFSYSAHKKPADWPEFHGRQNGFLTTSDHPQFQLCMRDAILYCNWLSEKEGIRPAYELQGPTGIPIFETPRFDPPDFSRSNGFNGFGEPFGRSQLGFPGTSTPEPERYGLSSHSFGYRLPSAAEWEYACRAGTTTQFSSGDNEDLLRDYSQFWATKPERCGAKLPNSWGLFDVHGNVSEFCWTEANERDRWAIPNVNQCVARGGSFHYLAAGVTSSMSDQTDSSRRLGFHGFRLAKSIPTVRVDTMPTAAEQNPR